ncbi:AAA family ATPase [Lactiplantibacillus plantarum]|uniref:ATP-binding protein n=1 Tax=Lactiplantibacillus plantarum TaxID=1590 RepID=UPI002658659C|nr:ATP-binding protein [Lactiplantibacillus plantarum]WKF80337.1 AAA family ATPase [Lactiplantibacillus plantarum]
MKVIKLISISYHNFKGIQDFTFEPDGESIAVSGQNATGKTTLFDGFTWLLFGKNSDDVKKFNPKPLNTDGTEQLGLDPEVDATLEIDGKPVRLHRKLAEKWIKPRGQADKQRKPDVTELTIDDVPQKVKDFTAYIDSIINEDSFKMLTNPFAFNNLKWQDRRELLLSLITDVSDDEVIEATGKADELKELLSDHTASDMKAIIAAQRRKLKAEMDGLPNRIDEATRAIPAESTISLAKLKLQLNEYKNKLTEAQQAVAMAATGDSNVDARNQKAQLQSSYNDLQMAYMQGNQLELSGLMEDINTTQKQLNDKRNVLSSAKTSLQQAKTALEVATTKHDELVKKWSIISELKFDEDQLTCPTCGQELQADKQEEVRQHFNVEKSNQLETVTAEGKQSAKDINLANNEIQSQTQAVESAQAEFDQVQNRLDSLNNDYNQTKASHTPFEETAKAKELQAEIDEQQRLIDTNSGDNSKAKQVAQDHANRIQDDIDHINAELANADQVKQQQERVKQLHAREDELKDVFMKLDQHSYLLDQYTRTRVTMLEERINKLFKLVNFKLFEIQKNGEINEICEATVDGVPFSTDLNNAARINAGLDIINTLSKHYQVVAPIFVDNAESVNQIADTEAQQIALVVSRDKTLTIEKLAEEEVA